MNKSFVTWHLFMVTKLTQKNRNVMHETKKDKTSIRINLYNNLYKKTRNIKKDINSSYHNFIFKCRIEL